MSLAVDWPHLDPDCFAKVNIGLRNSPLAGKELNLK